MAKTHRDVTKPSDGRDTIDVHRRTLWPTFGALVAFLCGAIFSFVGCSTGSRNVASSDLVGKYTVTYAPSGSPIARETLVLRPDGTYEQVFVPTRGKRWRNTGKWSAGNGQGGLGTDVRFDGLRRGLTSSGMRVRPDMYRQNVTTGAYQSGSSVSILIDDDLGYHYEKELTPKPVLS